MALALKRRYTLQSTTSRWKRNTPVLIGRYNGDAYAPVAAVMVYINESNWTQISILTLFDFIIDYLLAPYTTYQQRQRNRNRGRWLARLYITYLLWKLAIIEMVKQAKRELTPRGMDIVYG